MKILVTSLPDLKKIHPQRPHHLLKHLSLNHDITVLCVNAWGVDDHSNEFFEKHLDNIKFYYASKKKTNSIIQEIYWWKNFKKLDLDSSSFDAHINFNSLIGGFFFSKKTNLPTLFDVCDDLVEWVSISPQIPRLLKPLGRLLANFMLKKNIKASKIVTLSMISLGELFDIPPEKSIIIPNGVDTDLFCKIKKKTLDNHNDINHNDIFTIGFVGFLGDWVDFTPIFRVIKELKNLDIQMLVVGGGDNRTKFENIAKKMGIYDKIEFKGDVEYFEVPNYISLMDVCLLPFDMGKISKGALPLKLFEYMACEKPVISTPLESVKKSVGNLVLYADSSEELKNHITKLCAKENLRLKLGVEGRYFVKENYDWEKISVHFEELVYQMKRR